MERCLMHRRKTAATAVGMFFELLFNLMKLIIQYYNESESENMQGLEHEYVRETPIDRLAARNSFMVCVTSHGDISSTMLIRMSVRSFQNLCNLLRDYGGLRCSWNMEIDEMVAIFLYTIAHNEKNRQLQITFRRSGETISRVIKAVLNTVLKLHPILLRKPKPVLDNSEDSRWKHFKKKIPGFAKTVKSRHRWLKTKYSAICEIKNGGCSGFGWDETKKCVVADDDVYSAWVKNNAAYSGLKKPFLYFEQLARIFGKDRAMGSEAFSAVGIDVESTPNIEAEYVAAFNTDSVFDDETTQRVLEQVINDGVDHREFLNVPESDPTKPINSTGGNKRSRNDKKEKIGVAVATEIAKLHPLMEKATMNIEKIATSFCLEDELTIRRGQLYEELSKVEGLSNEQFIQAAMILIKDDRIAQLYYQLPTEDEKYLFLLRIIN